MSNSLFDSALECPYANEITAYHEAGHAVMARLFGRCVHSIELILNVKGTYNGNTNWGRDEYFRDWDSQIPYENLGLQQNESSQAASLVIASGKAAERIWYRQKGMDETLASFGVGGGTFNDERQLEIALQEMFESSLRKNSIDLPVAKHNIEQLATQLLENKRCWQAVEVVAHALLEGIKQTPQYFKLVDVQNLITYGFAQE